MALLARARSKNPDAGFVKDAVSVLAPLLAEIHERGIKVVTNAGALNPAACARAFEEAAGAAGVSLRIAAVEGDDLTPRLEEVLGGGAERHVHRRTGACRCHDPERLPGRAADRGGARGRCGHRGHRPVRRLRGRPRSAAARVRLDGHRLRPAVGRLARRPHRRVRTAVHRWQLHRLDLRPGLGRHGLPDHRVPCRRHRDGHEARGYRRPRLLRQRQRADPLRDRRPRRLHHARRRVRLAQRQAGAGGARPRERLGRAWLGAADDLQDDRDPCRRLPRDGDRDVCRRGRGGQGQADRPRADRARRAVAQGGRPRTAARILGRGRRRRGHLRRRAPRTTTRPRWW